MFLTNTVLHCPKDEGRAAVTPYMNQLPVSYCSPYTLGFDGLQPARGEAAGPSPGGWPWPTPNMLPLWAGRHYYTTGRIMDPTQTAIFFESTAWEGASLYCACLWPGTNPESYLASAGECMGIRTSTGPFAYCLTRTQKNAWGRFGNDSMGGMAYRHGGDKYLANLAFLDGHVESVAPKDLFNHAGYQPGFRGSGAPAERGWIWNLELPGGKTPNWYDQYNYYTRAF